LLFELLVLAVLPVVVSCK